MISAQARSRAVQLVGESTENLVDRIKAWIE